MADVNNNPVIKYNKRVSRMTRVILDNEEIHVEAPLGGQDDEKCYLLHISETDYELNHNSSVAVLYDKQNIKNLPTDLLNYNKILSNLEKIILYGYARSISLVPRGSNDSAEGHIIEEIVYDTDKDKLIELCQGLSETGVDIRPPVFNIKRMSPTKIAPKKLLKKPMKKKSNRLCDYVIQRYKFFPLSSSKRFIYAERNFRCEGIMCPYCNYPMTMKYVFDHLLQHFNCCYCTDCDLVMALRNVRLHLEHLKFIKCKKCLYPFETEKDFHVHMMNKHIEDMCMQCSMCGDWMTKCSSLNRQLGVLHQHIRKSHPERLSPSAKNVGN